MKGGREKFARAAALIKEKYSKISKRRIDYEGEWLPAR